jgi:hypothetical protein
MAGRRWSTRSEPSRSRSTSTAAFQQHYAARCRKTADARRVEEARHTITFWPDATIFEETDFRVQISSTYATVLNNLEIRFLVNGAGSGHRRGRIRWRPRRLRQASERPKDTVRWSSM